MIKEKFFCFILMSSATSLFLGMQLSPESLRAAPIYQQNSHEIAQEGLWLKQIRQLTSHYMGFEQVDEVFFSSDGRFIIFQAVPEGKLLPQVFVMKLDEGVPRLVSTGKGIASSPCFRPDGKKIIFASNHEDPQLNDPSYTPPTPGHQQAGKHSTWAAIPFMNIYEANPDGSGLRPLTAESSHCTDCAYSPDGTSIVFVSDRDGHLNLYRMQFDGTHIKQLTHTKKQHCGSPSFSPDQRHILFWADYDQVHHAQIYTIRADGGGIDSITFDDGLNLAPCWHPNGKVVLYTTSFYGHGLYEVAVLNIEEKIPHRITHHASFDGMAAINSTGSQIVWISQRGQDGSRQIFLADILPASFGKL